MQVDAAANSSKQIAHSSPAAAAAAEARSTGKDAFEGSAAVGERMGLLGIRSALETQFGL